MAEINPTYPQYKWFPAVLANASHSSEYLAQQLFKHIQENKDLPHTDAELKQWINKELIQEGFGIYDTTATELQLFIDQLPSAQYIFADIISRRAQIGWSTHGHSAVDVNIYGTAGAEALRGNHENTEIGEFLRDYLEVDVDKITEELNEKAKKQYGMSAPGPTEIELQEVSDHYTGLRKDL
jgi:alkaline phosphatase